MSGVRSAIAARRAHTRAWGGSPSRELTRAVRRLVDDTPVIAIVQAGDPVLREPAAEYRGQLAAPLLDSLVAAMRETMHAAPGVGLAAPQIGLGIAVAVGEDPGVPPADDEGRERPGMAFQVWINPAYTPVGEEIAAFDEGCLSIAGWAAVRRRPREIDATWQDVAGVTHSARLSGWNARIFQHETDHLRGELYLDRAEITSFHQAE